MNVAGKATGGVLIAVIGFLGIWYPIHSGEESSRRDELITLQSALSDMRNAEVAERTANMREYARTDIWRNGVEDAVIKDRIEAMSAFDKAAVVVKDQILGECIETTRQGVLANAYAPSKEASDEAHRAFSDVSGDTRGRLNYLVANSDRTPAEAFQTLVDAVLSRQSGDQGPKCRSGLQ